jgi:hypothetical protein
VESPTRAWGPESRPIRAVSQGVGGRDYLIFSFPSLRPCSLALVDSPGDPAKSPQTEALDSW